jgi:endonuclease I
MSRVLSLALLLFFGLQFNRAASPPNYYDSAIGKTGPALRQALHALIRPHTVLRYDSTSVTIVDTLDAVKVLDEDAAETNNVILIYSGWSVSKTNYPAVWNREHLWPESHGSGSGFPKSDLFNLRSCDLRVNSSRSDKFFDYSDPFDLHYRSSAHTNAPLCSTDTDSWEPPDSMKGDVARAIFYMDLCYEGETVDEPNLVLTDDLGSVASGTTRLGRLTTLLRWNQIDPVDSTENTRNDLIYERFQHNRNPFIDHPEWLNLVYLPRLAIRPHSAGVDLSWEGTWTNAVLETASPAGSGWAPVSGLSTMVDNQLLITLPMTNRHRLFRLRFP